MQPKTWLHIFLFVTFVSSAFSANILFIFPMASKSMANLYEPLIQSLAERGHKLTVVTPLKFNIKSDVHGKNVTQLIPVSLDQFFVPNEDRFDTRRKSGLFLFDIPLISMGCHKAYQNAEFRKLAKQKFDVIIVNILFTDCFAGLLHRIKAPVILFSSLPVGSPMMEFLGNYQPSSIIPLPVVSDFDLSPTFFQRTKNLLYNVHFSIMLEMWTRPKMEAIYREYLGKNLPSVREIYREKVSMIFINAHYSITRPRQNLPSVVEIGGIHCQPARPLPNELEEFVAGANDGFILFSLGSIVTPSQMPEVVRLAFVKTFAKLKQRVIWKWDKSEGMPDAPKNVKVVKWLPQQDLLGHPNIRLFITHGGLLSTEEAIYHGVPVVGLPIFVDQDSNMKQAELLGFGVTAEILELTETSIGKHIELVLNDTRYMKKAKELSAVFRDEPQTPLERAVFYTEYVIRHKGAPSLRSSALDLSSFQFHCVDIIAFLFCVLITILALLYCVTKVILGNAMVIFRGQKASVSRTSNKQKSL